VNVLIKIIKINSVLNHHVVFYSRYLAEIQELPITIELVSVLPPTILVPDQENPWVVLEEIHVINNFFFVLILNISNLIILLIAGPNCPPASGG